MTTRQKIEQKDEHKERLEHAVKLQQAGQLHEAKDIYREIILAEPNNADANNLLGCLAFQTGFHKEANKLITKAITINPHQAVYYINLGSVLIQLAKYQEAIKTFKQAITLDPKNIHIYINLGNALCLNEEFENAENCYRAALRIQPTSVEIWFNLANVLQKLNRNSDAVLAYQSTLKIKPNHTEALLALGNCFLTAGNNKEALTTFNKLLEIEPDNAEVLEKVGGLYIQEGKFDKAKGTIKSALNHSPDLAIAYTRLTKLEKYSEINSEVKKIEKYYHNSHTNSEQRMFLSFALGKIYEDIGHYEKSFHFLLEGNNIKRKSFQYNIKDDTDRLSSIQEMFNKNTFARMNGVGHPNETPIFIVGMPRSGTTLVEQILASHPEIYGAGELNNLRQIALKNIPESKNTETIGYRALPSKEECIQIGKDYIEDIRQYSSSAKYITNKLPNNFSFIGLIKLVLPNAKIIHCKRNPMDTCFSIFKNYFYRAESYFFDLKEIGIFYTQYQNMMTHWKNTLPKNSFYEVQYEDMVNNQQEETAKLLEFCNLNWDDQCLSFHKSKRVVSTISATQVRQPIYKDSLQKWEHYKKWLKPLTNELKIK